MENTTTFKKLVVFDFNIDWRDYSTDDTRYKDLSLVLPLIKQVSKFQTVVLSTSGNLVDAITFIKDKGINQGYLIASGGAVIYDLGKNEIIYKNPLTTDEVKTIFHHGMMLGTNMVFSTPTEKYIFISNEVTYEIIKEKSFSPYAEIRSYGQLSEICDRNDILDIAFVNLVSPHKSLRENFNIYKWERYFDNEISNIQIKLNQTSVFAHVANKASTKLNGVKRVMAECNIDGLNDVLYVASTCINKECFINFKNCLISSNPDFEYELKGINKKRCYLGKEINNIDPKCGLESDSFWK